MCIRDRLFTGQETNQWVLLTGQEQTNKQERERFGSQCYLQDKGKHRKERGLAVSVNLQDKKERGLAVSVIYRTKANKQTNRKERGLAVSVINRTKANPQHISTPSFLALTNRWGNGTPVSSRDVGLVLRFYFLLPLQTMQYYASCGQTSWPFPSGIE